MRTLRFALLAASITCPLFAAPAHAQRARDFVASYGVDSPSCGSFGGPCRTFQQAVDNVTGGGEVTAIDSAGFGTINITKSVSITSPNGVEAGIAITSGLTGITISAGPTDAVSLHGLTLDGAGAGQDGIVFSTGGSLTISSCIVRNVIKEGIYFNPSGSSTLIVSDTLLYNNGDAGIWLFQSGSTTVTAAFERVEASNNHNGFVINASSASGAVVNATIADSVAANNANTGISAVGTTTNLMVLRSVVANNGTGLAAQGANATLLVGQSTVTGNANGWGTLSGGILQSYGDNKIDLNTANESAPPPITDK